MYLPTLGLLSPRPNLNYVYGLVQYFWVTFTSAYAFCLRNYCVLAEVTVESLRIVKSPSLTCWTSTLCHKRTVEKVSRNYNTFMLRNSNKYSRIILIYQFVALVIFHIILIPFYPQIILFHTKKLILNFLIFHLSYNWSQYSKKYFIIDTVKLISPCNI